MNKAFEKILERLEELRQNQIKELCEHRDFTSEMQSMRGHNILQDAKKIVQEVAEEYDGGWIPCSDRLPEENQQVILQGFYGSITIEKMKISDGIKGFSDGDWWSSANNYVAWQPLPELYKERD